MFALHYITTYITTYDVDMFVFGLWCKINIVRFLPTSMLHSITVLIINNSLNQQYIECAVCDIMR